MTRSWAHVLAPRDINVNAILPGITDTPMQELVLHRLSELREIPYSELESTRLDSIPMKRAAQPAEIAALVRFLITDEAKYITGQALSQDGGSVMF
jgi:NAD(P)-dependent dehydrogenase (short-subunit alcohol dehydrogenase family)